MIQIIESASIDRITLADIHEMLKKAWTPPKRCPSCGKMDIVVEIEKKGFFRKRYALLTKCFDCGRIIQREEIRRKP